FAEEQADWFYGRDAELALFLERMRAETVMPVVGPSGAGKSSFVQAGVIPRLHEQGAWVVIRLRPGSQPFRALAGRIVDGLRGEEWLQHIRLRATAVGAPGDQDGAPAPAAPDDESARLAAELLESPRRLSLVLGKIARDASAGVLLFVDQIEELSTLVEDEAVRRRFIEAICTAADDPDEPVRVCFTLRDDFLGRVAGGAEAQGALSRLTVLR